MRQTGVLSGKVMFPDRWCYAFNKQYIQIDAPGLVGPLTVRVSDTDDPFNYRELSIVIFNGKANIEISTAIQLLFRNPLQERCKYIHVNVHSKDVTVINFHSFVVFGRLKDGDSFSTLGDLELTRSGATLTRKVIWFKKYPFTVSLFRRLNSESIRYSVDNGTTYVASDRRENIIDLDIKGIAPSAKSSVVVKHQKDGGTLAIFDKTFDMTFVERYGSMLTEEIKVIVKDESEGVYLRWIDRFGYLQYYLFKKGTVSYKNKSSQYTVDCQEQELKQYSRAVSVSETKTLSCCALNLDDKMLQSLETISSSPIVDLYRNDGCWEPVKVETSVVLNPKRVLHDLEVKISISSTSQTLT